MSYVDHVIYHVVVDCVVVHVVHVVVDVVDHDINCC